MERKLRRVAEKRKIERYAKRMVPIARAVVRLERGQSFADVRRAYPYIDGRASVRGHKIDVRMTDRKRRIAVSAFTNYNGVGIFSAVSDVDNTIISRHPDERLIETAYAMALDAARAEPAHSVPSRIPHLPPEVRGLVYAHISDKYKLRRMAEVNSAAKRRLDDIKKREKRRRAFHEMLRHPNRELNAADPRRRLIVASWTARLIPTMRVVRRIMTGEIPLVAAYFHVGEIEVRITGEENEGVDFDSWSVTDFRNRAEMVVLRGGQEVRIIIVKFWNRGSSSYDPSELVIYDPTLNGGFIWPEGWASPDRRYLGVMISDAYIAAWAATAPSH